ncbi:MAG: tRNA lysidine(34) synthetase TilS, partial [Actinomycetota bacterium]
EAEARRVRYAALEKIADELGCVGIATGHTLDDDAETVAMRQQRGGFALGIPSVRGRIVRPLLNLRRADTHAFCNTNGVRFVTDPTNDDVRFTRNRIRKELSDETILQLAALGRHNRIASGLGERSHVATALLAHGIEPKGALLTDIQNKVLGRVGPRLSVSKQSWVWWEHDRLVFGPCPAQKPNLPQVHLRTGAVRSQVRSQEWGLTFTVGATIGATVGATVGHRSDGDVAELDADVIGDRALVVRQWQPGDRFVPLGMAGSKKLQDLFTDLKVPRFDRERVPVLVAGDDIAWVVGYRIDDRFKIGPGTKNILRLACVK